MASFDLAALDHDGLARVLCLDNAAYPLSFSPKRLVARSYCHGSAKLVAIGTDKKDVTPALVSAYLRCGLSRINYVTYPRMSQEPRTLGTTSQHPSSPVISTNA